MMVSTAVRPLSRGDVSTFERRPVSADAAFGPIAGRYKTDSMRTGSGIAAVCLFWTHRRSQAE
ncbi:UNVERIFIED_ORG: hypothetical protein M2328_000579 [Rhodococcus erythropolis]